MPDARRYPIKSLFVQRLAKSTLTLIPLLGIHAILFTLVIDESVPKESLLRLIRLFYDLLFSSFQVRGRATPTCSLAFTSFQTENLTTILTYDEFFNDICFVCYRRVSSWPSCTALSTKRWGMFVTSLKSSTSINVKQNNSKWQQRSKSLLYWFVYSNGVHLKH